MFFWNFSCFFYDPIHVGNLISGFSAFSKSSLNIWKFTVHVLLKPGLENFENCFTSMWDEYNCVVVWTFFGIAFLWDWNENWHFHSVFILIPKKGNAKGCLNYHTIALLSQASKVMLKILQARLQQYVNRELPDVQADFRKGRGPEIKLPTSAGSSKKQESSRNTSISALLTMPKPLTVWITINCGKF